MSQLEIIRTIQSLNSPFFDKFFEIATNLHHKDFYIVTLPLLFWFYDKRFARYLLSVFLLGYWTNGALKAWFDTARPAEDLVRKLYVETATGGAFPSGHAQNPLMVWGAVALQFRRTWFTLTFALVVFLIGYSRVYGGLHWPIDVLGGWLIGGAMLLAFEKTRRFWLGEGMGLKARLLWAAAIPLAALAIWRSAEWDMPMQVAGDSWVLAGAYIGLWVGALIEQEYVGFEPRRGTWLAHAAKLVVGLAIVLGLRFGLKAMLPDMAISDGLRYFVIGLAVTLGLPWLFHRFAGAPSIRRTRGTVA